MHRIYLNLKRGYDDTALITRSDLVLKVGNFYVYKVDLKRKRGVTMILCYPIKAELAGLKRITNMVFYGKSRYITPKEIK